MYECLIHFLKNRTPLRKSWCGESVFILQLLKDTYWSLLSSLGSLVDWLVCSVLQQTGKVIKYFILNNTYVRQYTFNYKK